LGPGAGALRKSSLLSGKPSERRNRLGRAQQARTTPRRGLRGTPRATFAHKAASWGQLDGPGIRVRIKRSDTARDNLFEGALLVFAQGPLPRSKGLLATLRRDLFLFKRRSEAGPSAVSFSGRPFAPSASVPLVQAAFTQAPPETGSGQGFPPAAFGSRAVAQRPLPRTPRLGRRSGGEGPRPAAFAQGWAKRSFV